MIIMRKKNLVTLVLCIMLGIILPISNATTVSPYTVELLRKKTVEIDSEKPSTTLAYMEPENIYGSLNVEGNKTGKFQMKN